MSNAAHAPLFGFVYSFPALSFCCKRDPAVGITSKAGETIADTPTTSSHHLQQTFFFVIGLAKR